MIPTDKYKIFFSCHMGNNKWYIGYKQQIRGSKWRENYIELTSKFPIFTGEHIIIENNKVGIIRNPKFRG